MIWIRYVCTFLLCAGAVFTTGCGDAELPSDAVATVGDSMIGRSLFDKRLDQALAAQALNDKPSSYRPPRFADCIAWKRHPPRVPKDRKPLPADDLRGECRREYAAIRASVMGTLLHAEWIEQEARAQHVNIPSSAVERSVKAQREQAFETDKEYARFLREAQLSNRDILARVRQQLLEQKLEHRVTGTLKPVSDDEISTYYSRHLKAFSTPLRRRMRVALTKTRPRAERVKDALEAGASWKAITRRYSVDNSNNMIGGRTTLAKTGYPAFDRAASKARPGLIADPVKTRFGWYVFKIEKVIRGSQHTLEESTAQIKSLLSSQRKKRALSTYNKRFRAKYREKTKCAAGHAIADCSNGAEPG